MNIFGREVGGGDKPKKPLQLVQRGTDTRIPIELVTQPSGEVLDLSRFERLSVKIFNDAGTDATPPTDIQDNHLIVEVTADISQALGTGIYSVEVTGRVADTAFADGYHDYTIRTTLCRVTSDGSDATPTKVTANVIEGLKGNDGKSAYEIAVKHGYTGTEEEWAKSLVGNDGADAYEVAKAGGYQGSREAWLESLKGETGKDAYELAKEAQSFTGSLTEYLASLKGVNGKSAYQSYLDTTTDSPKLTEAQWAALNAITTQFLYRINKGKDAPMNEQTLSADQLLELQGNLIELANAMSKFGVVIDTRDVSIRSIIEDVKRSDIDLRLIVHRNDQFMGYPGERLPPLILNGSISCDSLFKNSGVVELPAIGDIELTTSIIEFIYGAPAIRRLSLPTLRFARDAWYMAGSCGSLEEVRIGDLPECAGLDDALSRNPKLRSVEIGACPKVDRMERFAYGCPILESVRIGLGNRLLRFNEAFNGCSRLRTIEGPLDLTLVAQISNGTFGGCTSLAEVRIKGLKTSINLADCQSLSMESIRYLVENAQTVTGQSIDLSRKLLETHEEELGTLGDTASDKGWTLNYR